jgi:CRISPR-associated exonuclease Cas4
MDRTAVSESEPWVVLISAIEHYSYCARQCALIHVEQTFAANVYTVRGDLAHRRVDSGAVDWREGVRGQRDVPVWSDALQLRGKADLVEFTDGRAYPVEYKVGRRSGRHPDLQLCAVALCLEEMLSQAVPRGAVFYHAQRKRVEIAFDAALRARTLAAVADILGMLEGQTMPPAPNDKRCPNCSLVNDCLPGVVGAPHRLRGLQGALFTPWGGLEEEDEDA